MASSDSAAHIVVPSRGAMVGKIRRRCHRSSQPANLVVVTGKTNCRQTQTGVAQEICCSGNVHRNAEDVLADEIEDFTQPCSLGVLETAAELHALRDCAGSASFLSVAGAFPETRAALDQILDGKEL